MQNNLAIVRQANDDDLNKIAKAVVKRYAELYPGWEIMYLAVPKDNLPERRSMVESIIEMLKKQYL